MNGWAVAVGVALAVPAAAQAPRCDRAAADRLTQAGWTAYRATRIAEADSTFRAALRACPDDPGPTVGLGFTALRTARADSARARFTRALAVLGDNHDALAGLGIAAYRLGDLAAARDALTRALALEPDDTESRALLARIPAPVDTVFAPLARPAETVLVARTGDRRFEVRTADGGWRPLWVKAVNIGAALPGKHPSEFPADDGTYEEWLRLCAAMGANAVRVYTIHPPHFYRALRRWNETHTDSTLWLIHGVWTELPPGRQEEDYDDPAWNAEFETEMRRVVDLVHGRAAIPHRPGHAGGRYDADVSPWTLGWITGREWEPYSVVAYARRHPTRTRFLGRYITLDRGNAVEWWLARFSERMIAYEMDRWNAQRPIAYTNWPTLDPLHHPTETTRAEEDALRRRRGEVFPEATREFDNDAIGLDGARMRATAAFPAGTFASYHAYPYYPDFLVLDPGYATARSPFGPSNYFGYLRELVEHHGPMPVVISEYGVPSSRGNAHFQPQGWHHGGHDEAAQARINARLTREIHAAGAAGAGLFAIIDEWFKKNWLVIDFEQPLERNRLWLNVLDAEQNYGVIAMRPGVRDSTITVDGDLRDWGGRGRLFAADHGALRALHVTHDEAWVYLALRVDTLDWTRRRIVVGIDTYDRRRGDARLPHTGTPSPVGLEFALDLAGPDDARLLVDRPYTLYRREPIRGSRPPATQTVWNRPFRTEANSDGLYDTLRTTPNRRRYGRDGTIYPAMDDDRNRLRHARQQETTLADWYADPATGVIEVRLPWGMLHVLDPSSRTVLFGSPTARDPEGVPTDGFRFVVEVQEGGRSAGRWPAGTDAFAWTWAPWETPRWYAEVKPLFAAMRDAFAAIPDPR